MHEAYTLLEIFLNENMLSLVNEIHLDKCRAQNSQHYFIVCFLNLLAVHGKQASSKS
jgi:hypothetical protein